MGIGNTTRMHSLHCYHLPEIIPKVYREITHNMYLETYLLRTAYEPLTLDL